MSRPPDGSPAEGYALTRAVFDVQCPGRRAVIHATRLKDPAWIEKHGDLIRDGCSAALDRLEQFEEPTESGQHRVDGGAWTKKLKWGKSVLPSIQSAKFDMGGLSAALIHLDQTRPGPKKLLAESTWSLLGRACGRLDDYLGRALRSGAPLEPVNSEKWLLLSHSASEGERSFARVASWLEESVVLRDSLVWRGETVLIPTSAMLGCVHLEKVLLASRCACGTRFGNGEYHICGDCMDHVACNRCGSLTAAGTGTHECSASMTTARLACAMQDIKKERSVSMIQVGAAVMAPVPTALALLRPETRSTAWAGVSEAVIERVRVLGPSAGLRFEVDSILRRAATGTEESLGVGLVSVKEQIRCLTDRPGDPIEGETTRTRLKRRAGKKKKQRGGGGSGGGREDERGNEGRENEQGNSVGLEPATLAGLAPEEERAVLHVEECGPCDQAEAATASPPKATEGPECTVCMESLTDSAMVPMVLPDCGHWLCQGCCDGLRIAKCPKCNAPSHAAPLRLYL